MVQTITPVVHGGSRARWGLTLALHVAGAALAAGGLGAVLGAAGQTLGAPWGREGAVALAVVAALYAARELFHLPMPVPELRRQVPEWWRASFPAEAAAFLYGLGLGIGFFTYLRHGTLVAVSLAAVVIGDPWIGMAMVAPFGIARAVAVATVWRATTEDRLGEVVAGLERIGERNVRRLANGAALVAVAAVALAASPPDGRFPAAVLTAALVVTFGWAAFAKVGASWERALDGYALPSRVRAAARVGVPLAEAAVAAILLSGRVRAGAVAAVVMLGAFSVAIARTRRLRGEDLSCGCFGSSRTRSARWLLGRNLGLAVLAAAVAIAAEPVPLPSPPTGGEALPAALVIGGGILAVMLLRRAAALWSRRPQPTG